MSQSQPGRSVQTSRGHAKGLVFPEASDGGLLELLALICLQGSWGKSSYRTPSGNPLINAQMVMS